MPIGVFAGALEDREPILWQSAYTLLHWGFGIINSAIAFAILKKFSI